MCMQQGCNLKVGHSVFLNILGEEEEILEKYWKWLTKSLTDENKDIRECPEPRCELVAEKIDDTRVVNQTIECHCGARYCFRCGLFEHLPCDCESAKEWLERESTESANTLWIMTNSKPCPGCKKPIQKDKGCNHMTCTSCRNEFCWVCMGDWRSLHGPDTGGFYKCNLFTHKM